MTNGNYTFVPKFGFVRKKLRFKLRMTIFVWFVNLGVNGFLYVNFV